VSRLKYSVKNHFILECGEKFDQLEISYTTYGTLNADASNAIWVCHALTADANPQDWWSQLVGADKLFNPDEHYIVCANMIGSCYGSSSPTNCDLNKRYNNFPQVSIRDNIQAFIQLKEHLGIDKINTLIGGSMGGQQALEWSIMDKNICKNLILLATSAVISPWAVAFNQSQRLAIRADQSWGQANNNAGLSGLKAARSIALLSYRNAKAYDKTQSDTFEFDRESKAISYQNYQGEKLVNRFNAYCYHALTKTMDTHDVGRNRGGLKQALTEIKAKTLVIGIESDLLFPIKESEVLAKNIKNASLHVIDSDFGHDGFLIESEKISHAIHSFYNPVNEKLK
jgi:homoserine O-acetyltransferase